MVRRSNPVGSMSAVAVIIVSPALGARKNPATAAKMMTKNPSSSSDNDDNDDESVKLPTSIGLLKELCKIVDTDHYSRDDSILALDKA